MVYFVHEPVKISEVSIGITGFENDGNLKIV